MLHFDHGSPTRGQPPTGWPRSSLAKLTIPRDGHRFLMIQGDERTETREIRIVQNWFAEVERLLAGTRH